jgi:hypothetical protein
MHVVFLYCQISFCAEKEQRVRSKIVRDEMLYSVMVSFVRGDGVKTIVNKLYRIPVFSKDMVQCVAKSVKHECKNMAKSKCRSVLQMKTPTHLVKTSFEETANEIKQRMPTFFIILDNALSKSSNMTITMPCSLVLWYNCRTVSRIQHTIGQILDISGATDEVLIHCSLITQIISISISYEYINVISSLF